MTKGEKRMNQWTLYNEIKKFDFSDGQRYIFGCAYDLRDANDIELLDCDSEDAFDGVRSLSLNYDIVASHYSTVVGGDHITDAVNVVWEFWKDG
jgi:hypothetical protein